MSRKKTLATIVTVLAITGVVGMCVPFVGALKPPAGALYKWQLHIDPINIQPGELKEYGEGDLRVWVYRRTKEQIDWLKNYTPTKVSDYVMKNTHSQEFGGKFRSRNKELFVFLEWRMDGKTYLQQERAWSNCGSIHYHEGLHMVQENRLYNGVIACNKNPEKTEFDGWGHIYDVAGIAASKYVTPLDVPYYEINQNGLIIIGPKP